jgi:hypothetical protein
MEEIKKLIDNRNTLAQQAFLQYESLVNQLIDADSIDTYFIEHTLDDMLEFCFDDNMRQLYRRLCRHLYEFAPHSALFYASAYRDWWDD